MKARALIDGVSYGPETLKAMGRALDEAWAESLATLATTLCRSKTLG
jgi:hypothetical protein